MTQTKKISLRGRTKSFQYAFAGIRLFFLREHNAWLHLAATVSVVIASVLFKVSVFGNIALAVAVGLVWVTEMLNTCIEKMMDFISQEKDPKIQFIKDVSAGAVLVASATALVIGLFIFIPKIL